MNLPILSTGAVLILPHNVTDCPDSLGYLLIPESNEGVGRWVDAAGLIAPATVINELCSSVAKGSISWLFQTAYHGICFLYKTGVVVVYGYHLVVFLRQAAHFVEIDLSALGIKINASTTSILIINGSMSPITLNRATA